MQHKQQKTMYVYKNIIIFNVYLFLLKTGNRKHATEV